MNKAIAITAPFFLMWLICGSSAAQTHVVPLDIRNHFIKNGCSEVLDYYSYSGVLEKPYLYGIKSVLSGRKQIKDFTFVAWCKAKPDAETSRHQYMLVGKLDGFEWPGGCKFPIRGLDYPGGISLSIGRISLKSFFTSSMSPAGSGSAEGPLLRSENDGLVHEVFCYKGKWIERNID